MRIMIVLLLLGGDTLISAFEEIVKQFYLIILVMTLWIIYKNFALKNCWSPSIKSASFYKFYQLKLVTRITI